MKTSCSICKRQREDVEEKNDRFICPECIGWVEEIELRITEQLRENELV
ncbi:hypothetical protein ACFOGI_15350 [Virgibacillus xinjiangensis]|uniref:Uncharacterized protein n=1 Tax=Virgibacillus xinjiangensis TaxID=393090 RepID=A0ABV7CZ12_9BACI